MKSLLVKRSFSVAVSVLSTLVVFCTSCNIIEPENNPITYGESYIPHMLSTDKAAYLPGEAVQFSMK